MPPQEQSTTPSSALVPPVISRKPRIFLITALVALIVLFGIGLVAWYFGLLHFYQNPSSTLDQTPVPTSTSTVQVTATTSESWVTYTYSPTVSNSLPSLSFQYPVGFGKPNIEESDRGLTIFFQYASLGDLKKSQLDPANLSGYQLKLVFNVLPNALKKSQSVSDFVNSLNPKGFWTTKASGDLQWISDTGGDFTPSQATYLLKLKDSSLMAVGTDGDVKYMHDQDNVGNSTRDKVIESIQFVTS